MSSNEWQKYTLGDIIDVKHGYAFKGEFFSLTETDDVILGPGNFKIGGGFKSDKFKYYNGNYPKDYILKENDIIVTMTDLSKEGDTLGYSAKIPFSEDKKYLHNQRLGLVQFKNDDFDKDYIYWLLRTKEYQNFIVNSATGTTVRHTAPTRIKEYEFFVPNKNTQTKIANILSSLDDKIELNRQTNLTLETIAQTLFREMCLPKSDELPDCWRIGTFQDVAKQVKESVKPSLHPNKLFHHYSLPAFDINEMPSLDFSETILSNKTIVKKYSVLFSKLNPRIPRIWSIGNIDESISICSTEFIGFVPKQNFYYSFINYFLKQSDTINKLIGFATGTSSSHQRVKPEGILNLALVIPSDDVLKKYNDLVSPFLERRFKNIIEIETLKQVRDNLLPKLMKGEIAV